MTSPLDRTAPLAPPPRSLSATGESAACAVLFAAGFLGWIAFVRPFQVPDHYWQFLPVEALARDPLVALANLHAQPPLLNVVRWLLLRAEWATGIPGASLAALAHLVLGSATAAGLSPLARRLVPAPVPRRAILLVLLANPYLYACWAQLFYTPWEMALLVAMARLALRHFDAPSPGRFAAVLLAAALLVNTRSLFHPAWLAAVALLLLHAAAPVPPGRRGRYALVGVAVLAATLAWPAKNLARFGFFGFSSWSGFNLATGLPVVSPFLEGMKTPPLPPALVAAAEGIVPPRFREDPGLAAAVKRDGSPNWNHWTVIGASRALGRGAVGWLREHPGDLLRKVRRSYFGRFALYEGRDPYKGNFAVDVARRSPASDVPRATAWMAAWEFVFVQRFRPPDPASPGRPTTGFAFLFPLLVALPAAGLVLRRRSAGAEERVAALMLGCVLWVTALALLVDGQEANRLRFSTQPFLALGAAWGLGAIVGALRRRRYSSIPVVGDDACA